MIQLRPPCSLSSLVTQCCFCGSSASKEWKEQKPSTWKSPFFHTAEELYTVYITYLTYIYIYKYVYINVNTHVFTLRIPESWNLEPRGPFLTGRLGHLLFETRRGKLTGNPNFLHCRGVEVTSPRPWGHMRHLLHNSFGGPSVHKVVSNRAPTQSLARSLDGKDS